MLLVLKLKMAAKAGFIALPLAAATVEGAGWTPAGVDIPQTVAVAPQPFAYRMAGDFVDNGETVDGPVETKRLKRFEIMRYQLNGAQYGECVAAGACAPQTSRGATSRARPAVMLSWEDARKYARWLSLRTGDTWRLPTDQEWIAAAGSRASDDGLRLPRGAEAPQRWLARYDRESEREKDRNVRPAGAFGTNENGLADIAGNVWEWTDTCFTRYAVSGSLAQAVTVNCGVRVVEGAHRTYMTNFIRDARAGGCAVGTPPDNLGVRLVREPHVIRRIMTMARGMP